MEVATITPPLPEGGGLLLVQATVLTSVGQHRHVIAVGVTMHHAACLGFRSTHFVHYWVANAAEHEAPPPSILDRSLTSDPKSEYNVFN
jgi:hypothetical protein